MLLFDGLFGNYEEFKELFGKIKHGNGEISRKNKLLLAYHKSMAVKENRELWNKGVHDMTHLQNELIDHICENTNGNEIAVPGLKVRNRQIVFHSINYKLDNNGICFDYDDVIQNYSSIRYMNCENGNVYGMKASKFLHKVIMESPYSRIVSQKCIIYLCEMLSLDFKAYRMRDEYELVVDNDFAEIYCGSNYAEEDKSMTNGKFNSCMTDSDRESFYEDCVEAKAARIYNRSDGLIYARCVVFTNVRDDETYEENIRLAERQYSKDGDEEYKKILIEMLKDGGHIDGYKKYGASCADTREFVSNRGVSWANREFSIYCRLVYDDVMSYQDSFCGYSMSEKRAYNYKSSKYDLQTTRRYFEGGNHDSWNDEYVEEDVVDVYYYGTHYTCSVNHLDCFIYVECEDEYHHENDVVCCEHCSEYFLLKNAVYSEITECDYCCDDCRYEDEERYCERHGIPYSTLTHKNYDSYDELEEAELEYKQKHWHYSSILDEYYKYYCDMRLAERQYIEERNVTYDYLGNEISNNVAKVYHKTYMPDPGTFLYKLHGECFTDKNGRVVNFNEYTDDTKYRIIGDIILDINPETNDIYEDAKKMFNL